MSRSPGPESVVVRLYFDRHIIARLADDLRSSGFDGYYGKDGWTQLVRVDFHSSRQAPTGTLHAILKAAGIDRP